MIVHTYRKLIEKTWKNINIPTCVHWTTHTYEWIQSRKVREKQRDDFRERERVHLVCLIKAQLCGKKECFSSFVEWLYVLALVFMNDAMEK